jgi:hypothetical protein
MCLLTYVKCCILIVSEHFIYHAGVMYRFLGLYVTYCSLIVVSVYVTC